MRFFHKKTILGCEGRGDRNETYLTRITLVETSRWQLCLHIVHRSDSGPRHNHPFCYWTFPLWRGYIDDTAWEQPRLKPFHFYQREANHFHRIKLIDEKPAVTLFLMGTRTQDWGFFEHPTGYIPWRVYLEREGCLPAN